jgi:hypothetical protein
MAKYSSAAFETFLVDGYDMRGAQPKGVALEVTNVVQTNTHGLGDKWVGASAVGLLSVTFTQTGAYFDDTVSGMHDAWKALTQVVRLVGLAMFGNTIGKRFIGAQGVYAGKYALGPKIGALVNADAGYVVSGAIDRGVIVQSWTQKAASWNTFTDGFPVDYTLDPDNLAIPITSNTLANPTIVTCPVPHGLTTGDVVLISGVITSTPAINGQQTVTKINATQFSIPVNVTVAGTGGSFVRASTNNGGVGTQLVSQYAGITGFIGKVRSSPDNITYADLPTVFANVTGPPPDATAAQRIVVAGVIARYLCYTGTFTGAGTITPFVGFTRNPPQ